MDPSAESWLGSGVPATFLVPADLPGLDRAAHLLRAHAEVCDEAAGALGRIEVTRWRGRASAGFHATLAVEPGRWARAAQGLLAGARALEAYAAAVPAARALADEATTLYAAYLASRQTPPPTLAAGASAAALFGPAPSSFEVHATGDPADPLRLAALETLQRSTAVVGEAARTAAQALRAAAEGAPDARRFDEETIRPAGAEAATHLVLDGLGLVPVVGAAADLGNSAWYSSEGDLRNASLSLASAVPGVGDALGAGVIAGRLTARSVDRVAALWATVPDVALGRGALSVVRAARDAPGQLLTHVPYGFSGPDTFAAFSVAVRQALSRSGVVDAQTYLRGSSVGGIRYRTGESVAAAGPGDFDVAVVSPELLDRLRAAGVGLRGGGSRSPVLNAALLERIGLPGLAQTLAATGSRPTTVMVYGSEGAILARGDAILLP